MTDYEVADAAKVAIAIRQIREMLDIPVLPAVIEVIDEGDCHRCGEHRPRHKHGTRLLLCRPCLGERIAFERRLAKKTA